jgi:nitroreductase
VPRETITKLIDLVRYAPTGSNSQLVRWTVVDSPKEVHHLAEIVIEYLENIRMAGDVSSPRYRFVPLIDEWKQGRDGIFRGAPTVLLAHAPESYGLAAVDCSIALSCLDLITPSFDLGTCWAGIFMIAFAQWEPLRKAVGLPKGDFCFGAMMLGFPQHLYHRLPPRKSAVVSWK